MILFNKDSFRIESLTANELKERMDPLLSPVYNNYTSFDTQGLNPFPDKRNELNQNTSNLYSLNLGLFHNNDFIGWSNGIQTADNRYYMKNSGILPKFRGQSLYTELLNVVMTETKKQGFLELYSNHNTDNNKIIIAKLKKGFFITGFEVLPKYGLTVQLSYSHSPELKAMHEYRTGKSLDPLIKDRFKD